MALAYVNQLGLVLLLLLLEQLLQHAELGLELLLQLTEQGLELLPLGAQRSCVALLLCTDRRDQLGCEWGRGTAKLVFGVVVEI
jgi:hypothetical protein